ncbi:MAG: ATP-binding cassette domain-containing protein [Betaproteobacteria bacterium]|nr:ATP-binding cassette domain-containing protein [Betaproteobacteria bacterium]
MASAIALDAVTKRYGSKTIIHDMSFTVEPGEIVGFLGPNGAGKTTTMRMIAGFTTATSGTVRVAGYDMATQNGEAAKRLGYLPEHPPLYDTLDVSSYLRFVASVKRVPRASVRAELDRVIDACRLEAVTTREIYKLSKGYRQRVGLAQALLGDPDVLLLDEPTAGLDPGQIQETREVIRNFGSRHAVLLSTHILPEVTLICRRVTIINQGRLLAVDSPAALQRASEQADRVTLVATAPESDLRAELLAVEGVIDVAIRPAGTDDGQLAVDCQTDAGEGVEARIARAVASRWSLHRLQREQPTLENVFLRYIQGGKQ